MKTKKYSYDFSKYNPDWILHFEQEQKLLTDILSIDINEIYHVGSTSIPGMSAKPTIDILISINNINYFQKEKLLINNYYLRNSSIEENTLTFFKLNNQNEKTINIHVCEKGSRKARSLMHMKDFLIANPKIANEYSKLKYKNYLKYSNSYLRYQKAKEFYLKELENKAFK